MTPENIIKALENIIEGIEHDSFTADNIRDLIKKIKPCQHIFKVTKERELTCLKCSYKQI